MKHIGKIAGLALSAVMALTMTAPAFASDYSFTTTALQDYYNSTSYEDVYGSQYNYGGRNVVDYDIPELEYGRMSTTMTGVMERTILPGLQQVVASTDGSGYGLGGENGGGGGPLTELVLDDGTGAGSGSTVPVIPDTPQITVPNSPAYTSVQGMAYKDGSIGTLKIAKLGISVKVWEGESTTSMAKGVGHYSSTSAWDGNVGLAGHNRGAKYNIGTIKNLVAGDTITYTTMYGTRTYQVTSVKTITNTDWSYLQGTADNRITITTCLENHPESRVCVQAVEVK